MLRTKAKRLCEVCDQEAYCEFVPDPWLKRVWNKTENKWYCVECLAALTEPLKTK